MLFCKITFDPALINSLAVVAPVLRSCAARWRGVSPALVAALTFAPCSIRIRVTSTRPRCAAQWRAVRFVCATQRTALAVSQR
jgi:hypothetical protein